MGACLRHIETILCDQFFFMNFTLKCSQEGCVKEKAYPVIHSPVYGKYIDEKCSSVPQSACKLQPFL